MSTTRTGRSPWPSSSAERTRRGAVAGVLTTVAVTLVLVAGDLLYRLGDGVASDPTSVWKIDEDGSLAEIVAWVAMASAAVLLAARARTLDGSPVLWAWAGVLLLVTADDMLQIHERGGGAIVRALGLEPALGLDAQGWGELAVWGLLGAVSLAALVGTFLRSGPTARRVSWYLLACVGVLGVAAVGVDMVAIVVEPYIAGSASWVVAMLESAGELAAAGLFLTVAWCFHRATRTVPAAPAEDAPVDDDAPGAEQLAPQA